MKCQMITEEQGTGSVVEVARFRESTGKTEEVFVVGGPEWFALQIQQDQQIWVWFRSNGSFFWGWKGLRLGPTMAESEWIPLEAGR